MSELISPELERKLKTCRSLPSPPTYALKVIELVNDPELDINQAVKVFSLDPVIVSKILRIANSPLYANQRQVDTLHMAVLLLGLNATISLALSFSLVTGLRKDNQEASLNHALYWKRTGLAAAASRVLGTHCQLRCLEELFITSLLQDIGMLALDRLCPALYADTTLNQERHSHLVNHERQQLGCSHATIGGWLLAQWQLPDRLHTAVTYSEDPLQEDLKNDAATFVRCVAGAGILADLLINNGQDQTLYDTTHKLEQWFDLSVEEVADLLEQMQPVLSEVDDLFGMNMCNEVDPEDLIEMAREGQLVNNLHLCQEVETLKKGTLNLESQNEQLEQSAQRDGLTQLYNRSFLDEYLDSIFAQSLRDGHMLTLGFLDLDLFKHVNDSYGHAVGDIVIKTAASIIMAQIRRSDVVGRYGGEEFTVVSVRPPKVYLSALSAFMDAVRTTQFTSHKFNITCSIGVCAEEHPCLESQLEVADARLYNAKRAGRDQIMLRDTEKQAS